MDTYGLILNNIEDPIYKEGNSKSVIDLILSTIEIGPLESWQVDLELSTPLDYKVISFFWEDSETIEGASKLTTR